MGDSHKRNQSSGVLFLTALGVVLGDIGTSPLYALRDVFAGHHPIPQTTDNIYSILSMIIWTMTIIISIKYNFIVLKADNRGEGGILSLMALGSMNKKRPLKHGAAGFLVLGLLGASFLVGDGMITPAISVLSALEGIEVAVPQFSGWVLPLTFMILIGLFSLQKRGTHKLGSYFGPVMVLWFTTQGILGINSIIDGPEILMAFNPYYAIRLIIEEPAMAMAAMGGVFLVATGGEALYADMGHFGRPAINRAWFLVAMPGLMLNYLGQGALLVRQPDAIKNPFYFLAPEWGQIPLIILATMATIIASQAIISGLFSLANQCIQLGYLPRLQIIHTSELERGQIYVPAVNWITMVGALWLVFEFKTSSALASAYGISVAMDMVITTILLALVCIHIWKWSIVKCVAVLGAIFVLDLAFAFANLMKIRDGGWVPLVIAAVIFVCLTTWKRGRQVLMDRIRNKSIPIEDLTGQLLFHPPIRVKGCSVFMVGDAGTTPPPLLHNVRHNKVLHETVIFLTVVGEETSFVSHTDRVTVQDLGDGMHRVIGHYGFMEQPNVMALIDQSNVLPPDLDHNDITFFLGREILEPGQGNELPYWRKLLFIFLSQNSTSANSFFRLPLDRVIEVGMRISL
jgi:KUP system potassium uptake protein